jgi:CheY-like chemotaxis protein
MAKTLLLADDSVTIQKVVGISFANEDVTLLTVDNGDDAVSRARESRPDIVLADVVMPGLNGYEVCEAIKSDPELRDTPVLLLTGTFEAFDEERATRVGADGYITKPFEAQALVDQVNARLARPTAAAPAPEPEPASAPLTAPEQSPSPEDPLGLHALPDMSPAGGESFDFFDEESTEPRTASEPASSAETMLVSDDFGVAGEETEDDFAFAAPDDLDDKPSTSYPSAAEAEIGAPAEMMEEWAEPEIASDSTMAIPADSDAFANAPTEPPSAPPILGKEDLAQLEPSEPSATPAAASAFEGLSASLLEEPAPTHIIEERATPEPDLTSEAASGSPEETIILSDLDTDPVSSPDPFNAIHAAEPSSEEDFASDPMAQVEPDDLAVGAVLDPVAGRDFDVSSSDLGDPLEETESTLEATEEEPSSPWSVEAPALEEGEVLGEPGADLAPEPAPEAVPESAPDPVLAPQEDAPALSSTSAPDLSPLTREQLHDALEKVAWEAFSNVTEQIVKEALERVESVAWEVIPQMAEALIREELRKLKGEED